MLLKNQPVIAVYFPLSVSVIWKWSSKKNNLLKNEKTGDCQQPFACWLGPPAFLIFERLFSLGNPIEMKVGFLQHPLHSKCKMNDDDVMMNMTFLLPG